MAVGWYRLPRSGQPYHGPIPHGAVECGAPGEEPVDGGQSGTAVDAGVLVDEELSKAKKVGRRPAAGTPGEQKADSDDDVGGQGTGQ